MLTKPKLCECNKVKLQRPDLESCRAEAMFRLFIAEHCSKSTVYKHATIS